MHRTRKRGFTITELVIVIAVIAILAAVLIPTFASLIEKANLSSDIQAVRQMNMVLAAESAVEKPTEFSTVCTILGDAGYDDQNGMRPVSENHRFLWHKDYNIIFLAKIVAAENEATVVSPEDIAGLSFVDYNHYKNSLGDTVFDLAYPNIGYVIIPVTGVSLDKDTLALSVDETATLTATVAPNEAINKAVNWSSSDTAVATVDENGLVTAVASGVATITVTTVDGGKTATCAVTVTGDEPAGGGSTGGGSSGGDSGTTPDGPSISPAELTLALGDTATLTIVGIPEGTEYSVQWKPSAAGIVTVNKSGKVTAKGPGTVTVTATVKAADGTVIGTPTCTVTVLSTVTVNNAEELVDALKLGGKIKLGGDILLQTPTDITIGTELDLNGHTLKLEVITHNYSVIKVKENASLTIVGNGELQIYGFEGTGGIFVAPGGTLNLNGIVVGHQSGICLQNHGNLAISGCTFTGTNQTIYNGSGVTSPGTLYIESTNFYVDAQNKNPWPVIWNQQGSTVKFGNKVTINAKLQNAGHGGAFVNEEGGFVINRENLELNESYYE